MSRLRHQNRWGGIICLSDFIAVVTRPVLIIVLLGIIDFYCPAANRQSLAIHQGIGNFPVG